MIGGEPKGQGPARSSGPSRCLFRVVLPRSVAGANVRKPEVSQRLEVARLSLAASPLEPDLERAGGLQKFCLSRREIAAD